MHPEVLSDQQTALLPLISQFCDSFGLVGGTAVALQIGHRRSIDFDLFSFKPFENQHIKAIIHRQGQQIDHTFIQGESELTVLVNGVKLTFYHFPYPIDFSQDFQGIVNLPDLLTLTAMKVFALGKRAKWKDYVDLYFLFKKLKFTKVLAHAEKLFGSEFNEKLLRVQLSYFKDIDYSEEVEFLPGFAVDPEQVEQFLVNLSVK